MTKPTLIAGLRRRMKLGHVEYATALKRYRSTSKGFEDLRTRTAKRVIAEADVALQLPLSDIQLNRSTFASLFIRGKIPLKRRNPLEPELIGAGYLAGTKKRNLAWTGWLFYLIRYAQARNILQPNNERMTHNLIKAWQQLFPHPQEIVVVDYFNSEAFLNWLKTPPAEATLREVMRSYPSDILEVH